jgi:hypothetical protein
MQCACTSIVFTITSRRLTAGFAEPPLASAACASCDSRCAASSSSQLVKTTGLLPTEGAWVGM